MTSKSTETSKKRKREEVTKVTGAPAGWERWWVDQGMDTAKGLEIPENTGPIFSGERKYQQTRFKTIRAVFDIFFTEAMCKHIIDETNNRSTSSSAKSTDDVHPLDLPTKTEKDCDPPGRTVSVEIKKKEATHDSDEEVELDAKDNEPLSVDEFRRWIAVWITMGLCSQPTIHNYWVHDTQYHGIHGNVFIRDTMTRNRWIAIRSKLKFNIHTLIEMAVKQTKSNWRLKQWINIDDQLALFKGRYAHRQHVRGKPHATGLKFYPLCDESKFVWDMIFYHGQSLTVLDLVQQLVADINDTYCHILIMDSWFGHWDLAEWLHTARPEGKDLWFLMATSKNKPSWLFSDLLLKDLPKGHSRIALSDREKIGALAWHDKKRVCFLSNSVGNSEVESKRKHRKLPEIVNMYNLHSHYVDQADAMLSEHLYPHRNRKWTQCALQTLLQITINNSIIYWEHLHEQKLNRANARADLANDLAPRTSFSASASASSKYDVPPQHVIVNSKNPLHHCAWCYEMKGTQSRTAYNCTVCVNQQRHPVALHPDCFKPYHDKHGF
jgi:hypothetical protein